MHMIGVHACTHTYIALVCAKLNNTLITLFGFPLARPAPPPLSIGSLGSLAC